MANGLSFIRQPTIGTTQAGRGGGPFGLGGGTPIDTGPGLVEELLSQLRVDAPEPPPKIGTFSKIAGAIADALTAAATVKAGGTPPRIGTFAATTLARQEDFEQRTADAAAANRDLEKRIRIGEFETQRRVRFGRQEQIAQEERAEQRRIEADTEKRRLDLITDVRKGMIEKIVELGIDTQDREFVDITDIELKQMLDAHDPAAGFAAILGSIPADMTIDNIRVNKDGTVSFNIEPKGRGKEIPAGIISALIVGGQDPSPFITDPKMAAAGKAAADFNKRRLIETEADTILQGIRDIAAKNIVDPLGDIDRVNQAIASAAEDLRIMGNAGTSPEKVRDWYLEEADAAVEEIELNEKNARQGMTPDQAQDFLVRLRQMIKIRFGEISLTAPPPSQQARTRPAP